MIATVVECDWCGKQLRIYGTNSIEFVTKCAGEFGWEMGKKHMCNECRERKVSADNKQQEETKIKENDYHCGNCEVIEWCGKVPFSDLALCKNSIVNRLTAAEYIEKAKEIDTSELEKGMIGNDFESEDEYDDYLMQLICKEVEKKIVCCGHTEDKKVKYYETEKSREYLEKRLKKAKEEYRERCREEMEKYLLNNGLNDCDLLEKRTGRTGRLYVVKGDMGEYSIKFLPYKKNGDPYKEHVSVYEWRDLTREYIPVHKKKKCML